MSRWLRITLPRRDIATILSILHFSDLKTPVQRALGAKYSGTSWSTAGAG
jgi:hypothetical protein